MQWATQKIEFPFWKKILHIKIFQRKSNFLNSTIEKYIWQKRKQNGCLLLLWHNYKLLATLTASVFADTNHKSERIWLFLMLFYEVYIRYMHDRSFFFKVTIISIKYLYQIKVHTFHNIVKSLKKKK